MCCLFGVLNYSQNQNKELNEIINCLSREATARGTDSTGISYVKNNKIVVYKRPLSAYDMEFKGVENCISISGHTRHATQGSQKKNYNNHPFTGHCNNMNFALSHNGVLWNDNTIRKNYDIKQSKIETDSYIAVQLLEYFNELNFENIKKMSEIVRGSFCFSLTDTQNNLWLIKGDNPLCLVHFPEQKLYCYASTDNILFTALSQTELINDIVTQNFEIIPLKMGDIFKINKYGDIEKDCFSFVNTGFYDWRDYYADNYDYDYDYDYYDDYTPQNNDSGIDLEYLNELKFIANTLGIDPKLIDELLKEDFTLDEIEEYIYDEYYYDCKTGAC